eukprot:350412-Karenia_brevis.AAC.1
METGALGLFWSVYVSTLMETGAFGLLGSVYIFVFMETGAVWSVMGHHYQHSSGIWGAGGPHREWQWQRQ